MVSVKRISRLIKLLLNQSHHARPSAVLEEYDGFSDSQEEEMTEEQHGILYRRIYRLLPPMISLQLK